MHCAALLASAHPTVWVQNYGICERRFDKMHMTRVLKWFYSWQIIDAPMVFAVRKGVNQEASRMLIKFTNIRELALD
jgi:hypothetical protein